MQPDYLEPTVDNLRRILQKLRAPDGCPWDREQTSQSLSRCMAEECAEALEAIDSKDAANLKEELGDLLMNVVFQAVVAEEKGEFTWLDVQKSIVEKMVRRHAHVFGRESASTPEEVRVLWEKIKSSEPEHRAKESVLDGMPKMLSALAYAEKLQRKVAKYGFDWTSQEQIFDKIDEELSEVIEARDSGDEDAVDEELGDLLFSIENLIRFRNRSSGEELLRAANAKFERRFRYLENRLKEQNKTLDAASVEEMEALYIEAKAKERLNQ